MTKTFTKGRSFEAEFRSRVLNAKVQAYFSSQKIQAKVRFLFLESLHEGREFDLSSEKYFDPLKTKLMPRAFTYIVAEYDENGKITKAHRTIVFMEERVANTGKLSSKSRPTRRPDLFRFTYEVDDDELKALNKTGVNSKFEFEKYSKANEIKPKAVEMKSIDGNTPFTEQFFDTEKIENHVQKHIETFKSSADEIIKRFKLKISDKIQIVSEITEFYHYSLNKLGDVVKERAFFLKEMNRIKFSLSLVKGALELIQNSSFVESVLPTGDSLEDTVRKDRVRIDEKTDLTKLKVSNKSIATFRITVEQAKSALKQVFKKVI
jgi:hypothetical protein